MVIDKNIDLLFKKSKTLGGSVVFGLTALIDTISKFFQNYRTEEMLPHLKSVVDTFVNNPGERGVKEKE
jgi:hypothetical protein